VLCLLQHPDQCAALRADPALARCALEEVLRHETPVKISPFLRVSTIDIEIGGVVIPAHQPILFALGAANRDPARFSDPDRFDLFRPAQEHLGFGHGIHFCLGAPLSRMEGEIAVNTLFAACPDLALAAAPSELEWRRSRSFRGLKRLPVAFTPPSVPAT
jgi:pikromycin synthase